MPRAGDERGSFMAEAVIVCLAMAFIFLAFTHYGIRLMGEQQADYGLHTANRFLAARLPVFDQSEVEKLSQGTEVSDNLLYKRITWQHPSLGHVHSSVALPPLEGM